MAFVWHHRLYPSCCWIGDKGNVYRFRTLSLYQMGWMFFSPFHHDVCVPDSADLQLERDCLDLRLPHAFCSLASSSEDVFGEGHIADVDFCRGETATRRILFSMNLFIVGEACARLVLSECCVLLYEPSDWFDNHRAPEYVVHHRVDDVLLSQILVRRLPLRLLRCPLSVSLARAL